MYIDNQSLDYSSLLSLIPTINLRTANANFTQAGSSETLNPGIFTVQIIGAGGQSANLLTSGATQPVTLSNTYTNIYTSVLQLLSSGLMNLRYAIPNTKVVAWKTGTYTNKLDFQLAGVNLASLKVLTNTMNIIVDPLINVNQPNNIIFRIDDLNYFRSKALPAQKQNFLVQSTVKPYLQAKTESSSFSYTGGYAGANIPAVSSTVLLAQLTIGGKSWDAGQMSSSYRNLSPVTGHEVVAGNTNNLEVSYSINSESLRSSFLNKGNYLLNLKHLTADAEQAGAASQELSSTAQVVVSDMAELKVNHSEVSLAFKTAEDYRKGVSVDLPAHLSLSSTAPYDVFVQASSSNLSSGSNSIPVGILSISASSANTSDTAPLVLTASRQKLMTTLPVIDKQINIRYTVNAQEAAKLLSKAAGTYTSTITYSLVAP